MGPLVAVATALLLALAYTYAFTHVARSEPRTSFPPIPSQSAVALSYLLDREQADDRASRDYLRNPFPTPKPTPKPKPKPTPVKTQAPPPPVVHSSSDPTVGLSKSQRRLVPFATWLASPTAQRVLTRESHGSCTAVSSSGKYRGRWQMDANFWRSYGGLAFAPRPDAASCHHQDIVAFRGWIASGWAPWPTA